MSAWSMGQLEGAASFHTSPLFSSKASGAPSLAWLKTGMLLLRLKLKKNIPQPTDSLSRDGQHRTTSYAVMCQLLLIMYTVFMLIS